MYKNFLILIATTLLLFACGGGGGGSSSSSKHPEVNIDKTPAEGLWTTSYRNFSVTTDKGGENEKTFQIPTTADAELFVTLNNRIYLRDKNNEDVYAFGLITLQKNQNNKAEYTGKLRFTQVDDEDPIETDLEITVENSNYMTMIVKNQEGNRSTITTLKFEYDQTYEKKADLAQFRGTYSTLIPGWPASASTLTNSGRLRTMMFDSQGNMRAPDEQRGTLTVLDPNKNTYRMEYKTSLVGAFPDYMEGYVSSDNEWILYESTGNPSSTTLFGVFKRKVYKIPENDITGSRRLVFEGIWDLNVRSGSPQAAIQLIIFPDASVIMLNDCSISYSRAIYQGDTKNGITKFHFNMNDRYTRYPWLTYPIQGAPFCSNSNEQTAELPDFDVQYNQNDNTLTLTETNGSQSTVWRGIRGPIDQKIIAPTSLVNSYKVARYYPNYEQNTYEIDSNLVFRHVYDDEAVEVRTLRADLTVSTQQNLITLSDVEDNYTPSRNYYWYGYGLVTDYFGQDVTLLNIIPYTSYLLYMD